MKKHLPAFILLISLSIGCIHAQKLSEKAVKYCPNEKTKKINLLSQAKGGEPEVYWSEDFSNGLAGQDDNSQWTTGGEQGDLWFLTFPLDTENGYDPESPIDGYGDFLPNYCDSDSDIVSSPTRENGIMMLDADRFNSTSSSPDDDPLSNTTSEPIFATLISPSIDLTGNKYADLCFYTKNLMGCELQCKTYIDINFDSEESWERLDSLCVGPNLIDQEYCTDLSSFLLESPDISNVKIRFRWPDYVSHYYWMLDDLKIQAKPANDLEAGSTWYNNFHELIDSFEEGLISASEYYEAFEYLNTPACAARPLSFSMEVSNVGTETQTNVQLEVTVTTPSGTILNPFVSESVSLTSNTTDTLKIPSIPFGDLTGEIPLQNGEYTIEFQVFQAEEDISPENNQGTTRKFKVSGASQNDGFAIYRNDGDANNGAYADLSNNAIWGTAYVFSNYLNVYSYITHVEAVLQYNEGFAETLPGQTIYFNVRQGSVLEEDPGNPETVTTVFFDAENSVSYEIDEIEVEITEDDIWNQEEDSLPYGVWLSFMLPNPILINPGDVYQAEFRVPNGSEVAVFPAVTSNQEPYSSFVYDGNADPPQWHHLGSNAIPIRFRTTDDCLPLSVSEYNSERGIRLFQNYPNPFNDVTRIQYRLDQTSDVTFEVFDISGRLVYAEDHGTIPAGIAHTFIFRSKNLSGGVYTYSIVANGERVTRKLTIE